MSSEQDPGGGFSMDLGQDLRDVRDWVHEFAETVIRPAGSEWDEREETPWPILQQASKVGLYSLDFFAQQWLEPTGLGIPVAWEELFWGDAGIALSIVGTGLAAVAVSGNGTHEQMAEWLPPMFGDTDDVKLGAFCVSEADAGSDVAAIRTRAEYQEATDEWVLNGAKSWVTNGGIANVHVVVAAVDPALGLRGQASFIVPPGTRGLSQGQKVRKHGIRASHTAEVVLDDVRVPGRCLVGGKERLDARLARTREGVRSGEQSALKTFEATRPAVAAMAVGVARAAYEYARDYSVGRVQAGRGGDRGQGHRAGDPDPRRQRLHPRLPGRALAPRRQDLHDLRGHLGNPAPDHRPRRHRPRRPLAQPALPRALPLPQGPGKVAQHFMIVRRGRPGHRGPRR